MQKLYSGKHNCIIRMLPGAPPHLAKKVFGDATLPLSNAYLRCGSLTSADMPPV